VTLTPVKSSNVVAVGYDPAAHQLFIQFKGGLYRYAHVPSFVYGLLLKRAAEGESVGKFVNEFVKPGFAATKLDRLVTELRYQVAERVTVKDVPCSEPLDRPKLLPFVQTP
jgi:hypothetical protein